RHPPLLRVETRTPACNASPPPPIASRLPAPRCAVRRQCDRRIRGSRDHGRRRSVPHYTQARTRSAGLAALPARVACQIDAWSLEALLSHHLSGGVRPPHRLASFALVSALETTAALAAATRVRSSAKLAEHAA